MDEPVQRIRQTTVNDGNTQQVTRDVIEPNETVNRKQNLAARIVGYTTMVLITLLGVRFILALLGANPNNAFADFILTISRPFVAPFFSLFNYSLDNGVARFEVFTLVAIAIYGLVGYGIAKLVTISQDK